MKINTTEFLFIVKHSPGSLFIHSTCAKKFGTLNRLCYLCVRTLKIDSERVGAADDQQKQAKRMKLASIKKCGDAPVGTNVRIPVPKVDRGKGDFPNLMGVVEEITEEGFYRIGTRNGTLERLFARSQFTVCPEKIISVEEVPKEVQKISVRTVAKKQSNGSGQGMQKCDCAKNCQTKKCSCLKAGHLCNSRCHKSSTCCNK